MYTISMRDRSENTDTRAAAIVLAKEISAEHRGKVTVEDDRGRELMTYVGGELESYQYETRPDRLRDRS